MPPPSPWRSTRSKSTRAYAPTAAWNSCPSIVFTTTGGTGREFQRSLWDPYWKFVEEQHHLDGDGPWKSRYERQTWLERFGNADSNAEMLRRLNQAATGRHIDFDRSRRDGGLRKPNGWQHRPTARAPNTDIQSAPTAFEKAWCSAFKDATAQPHPSPLIDTGDVTHIAEELPNGMDSPRESALETREERRCRFSLAVGALRAAAQDAWSPVYFRARRLVR